MFGVSCYCCCLHHVVQFVTFPVPPLLYDVLHRTPPCSLVILVCQYFLRRSKYPLRTTNSTCWMRLFPTFCWMSGIPTTLASALYHTLTVSFFFFVTAEPCTHQVLCARRTYSRGVRTTSDLPLADLVRDPQKLADLVQQKVSTLMAVHPDAPPPNIYCLCRRGNASTRATSFLLRLLGKFRSPEEAMEQGGEVPLVDPILSTLQVFNIAGGLQQYASTVNPRFPLY